MGIFLIILFTSYLIYYSVNIVYDMFFKKEKVSIDQQYKQEFSLNFVDDTQIKNVEIDDVQDIVTTSTNEINEEDLDFSDREQDDEDNFSYGQQIKDDIQNSNEIEEKNTSTIEEKEDDDNIGGEKPTIDKTEVLNKNKRTLKNILNLAETNVQTITIDGVKVFSIPAPINKVKN